ncbi:MAG: hydroxymethylpyrimidine/phosphomethylpyrimidine kinase [Planctomycetota bacterium]|jgi:hydroxymethylpyrimidine/phosphomethylpyrimidine kinase
MNGPKFPIALTLAGSDCSGGAGLQADLKTFAALGVYGSSVVTALTAQNTTGVFGIHAVPTEFIRAQADAVFDDLDVGAIKVGMLGNAETIDTVVSILEAHPWIPVVVDPVMVTAGGDSLLASDAIAALRERLLPLALLLTPNIHEAGLLLGEPAAESVEGMKDQAKRLLELGAAGVLLKGGRRPGTTVAADVLCLQGSTEVLESPRIDVAQPQGTGCTLSSAVAARLAAGAPLREAVIAGKRYVVEALERALKHRVGRGARPLIH